MTCITDDDSAYSTGIGGCIWFMKWYERWCVVIPRLLWYWTSNMLSDELYARLELLLIE
jgi:hypothetical protein